MKINSIKKHKYVYYFGPGRADGDGSMKSLLGGKGANLAEMTRIRLPVPPGFTITTEVCTYFYAHKRTYPSLLNAEVNAALEKLTKAMGKRFGDANDPLLVSVRSGARASMPGMMDTILNLGLNDLTVQGLIRQSRNERFAYDSYRRFVQMYGDVVMGVQPKGPNEHEPFETVMAALKKERNVTQDLELTAADLKELVSRFKKLIRKRTGKDFPDDPREQLWGAIGAVFGSWMNDRAIAYRKLYNIPADWGTAVSVQAMVFGNMGGNCATGVAFTRNPASGEKVLYGEYLINAQGEDVVAGIRTPKKISDLKTDMPINYRELEKIRAILEKHYREMQDLEFTIQNRKLYMLQTRNGKRTGFAAVKIAVDMVVEKLISQNEALRRVEPEALNQLLRPIFDPKEKTEAVKRGRLLAMGLNASPGAATGRIVFNARDAEDWAARKEKVILCRVETSPEDIRGMNAAEGILTSRGGVSSHAALVARQMGKVCVAGCGSLYLDYAKRTMTSGKTVLKEGDWISLDGTTGEVISGKIDTKPSEVLQVLLHKTLSPHKAPVYQLYAKLMKWADAVRKLRVRMNADQPDQAANGIAFGAEGVGLCRTEHMFFEGNRIDAVREMIIAETKQERQKALAKLLPYQRDDFAATFRTLKGLPITIRTLDPPLHEFLPHDHSIINDFAEKIGMPVEKITARVQALHEANPMLGHRGCRLGIVYPEITEMQVRAVFEAAAQVQKEGIHVQPEIMIPLVGYRKELQLQVEIVHRIANEVQKKTGTKIGYSVGTMIEVPRGALTADEIARDAQFFSFGTNDLTQTCLGMSRDDSGSFLPAYEQLEIVQTNPFASIDRDGVGRLMQIAVEGGRKTRPDIKLGICGEHGGDPATIKFCHQIGLNYVSCSPFRVPIARLAAAQAVLEEKKVAKK